MKNVKKRGYNKSLLFSLVLILIFLAITLNIANHGQLQNLDEYINQKMPSFQTQTLTSISVILTNLLSLTGLIILSLIVLIILISKKRILDSKVLLFGLAGGAVIETILKLIVQRIRPENAIAEASGFSFPSGHATIAIIFFSMIIIFFKDKIKSGGARLTFVSANVLVIILIGLSRVYLNVHWFSDVIAGFILGAFWLIITLLIIKK